MVVEKCAVRSENCLSHTKVVFTSRRLPVYEQGPDADTNGSDEKHRESHLHHRTTAWSPSPSWHKNNHKQAHTQDEQMFAFGD